MNWKNLSLNSLGMIAGSGTVVVVLLVYFVWRVWPVEGDAAILVHGLSEEGSSWASQGVIGGLTEDGRFVYMGDLFHDESGRILLASPDEPSVVSSNNVPLFTVTFRQRGEGDIRRSGEELGSFVERVKELHPDRRFTLVGFSLGGVIAREYLTSSVAQRKATSVRRLVTISSPHLGSELAYLSHLIRRWKGEPSFDSNPENTELDQPSASGLLQSMKDGAKQFLLSEIEKHSAGLPRLDSEAASMLLPPDFGGSYLKDLNSRPHPDDVEYLCIITEKNLMTLTLREISDGNRGWNALKSTIGDLIRESIRQHRGMDGTANPVSGDGAVSLLSQDLNQIPAFASSEGKLKAKAIHIEGAHTGEVGRNLAGVIAGLVLESPQASKNAGDRE